MRLFSHVRSRFNALRAASPPALQADFTRPDYLDFMKAEIMRYTPAYAKGRVITRGEDILLRAAGSGSVVLGLLHHGSWILIGGVVRHVLDLPYTVIASRRNFSRMPKDEVHYWQGAHRYVAGYYQAPLLFSDEPVGHVLNWLKTPGRVLGVAFDVREHGKRHRECQVRFGDHRIWAQTAPARIARLAHATIVPASIHYRADRRRHQLEFHPPIDPRRINDDAAVTQAVFSALQDNYLRHERQGFNNLVKLFSRPQQ